MVRPEDGLLFVRKALIRAGRGEDPGYYDNSTFYRVDRVYEGKILALFYNDWTLDVCCGKPVTSAYLPNGKQVEVKTERPLAYNLWGKSFKSSGF